MYLYFGYPQVPDIQNNGNLWNLNIDEAKLLSLLSWTVLGDYGKVITKVVENSQSSAHASHDKPFPGWLVTALRKRDMPATDMTISNPILETTPEVFGSYDKQINMFMSDGKWTSSGGLLCRETPN
ncbi:hypothetical protein B0I72DRAFT_129592 [Yarrowia lipolytica]|nr:hypothetical protein B0I72DRAFT_129592 [Yarrowia lipolytica]